MSFLFRKTEPSITEGHAPAPVAKIDLEVPSVLETATFAAG